MPKNVVFPSKNVGKNAPSMRGAKLLWTVIEAAPSFGRPSTSPNLENVKKTVVENCNLCISVIVGELV